MQDIVAGISDIMLDIEFQLKNQIGCQPLPFPGMDKSSAAVCDFFVNNTCSKGAYCPFRHTSGEKTVVCKHWLRGLCKKGDQCEFLHQYDMTKMPECYFYSKFGECSNKECQYLHIDPQSKIKDCPWYDRGFCKHGPHCRHRHVRRVLCINYLCGFCPEGPKCKHKHPRFELPIVKDEGVEKKLNITCHSCGQPGHKASMCPQNQMKEHKPNTYIQLNPNHTTDQQVFGRRPLETVTCFKCGDKGHYANKCPKSRSELIG
ncbi:cleavage and polyadenylation specificity factor subunit 4-like [Actinia tenebrosa]|uniref:Cleavage and polyadenylation specificity factor subunit 4 n=1 Tax=Actinia tenebrosa TaxID=6105 RepID=A0A6P8I463_ACTTE|nr:cleavage and polyadenylation specificity factor subunit 4-like [Actinia tenebrosa]